MCLSKYSNLEHLQAVASNLCLSGDHRNINGLCERELAALIYSFYQVRKYKAFCLSGPFHLKPHKFWSKKIHGLTFFPPSSILVSGPIIVHNSEYQPPVTYGSRVTGCTKFVN